MKGALLLLPQGLSGWTELGRLMRRLPVIMAEGELGAIDAGELGAVLEGDGSADVGAATLIPAGAAAATVTAVPAPAPIAAAPAAAAAAAAAATVVAAGAVPVASRTCAVEGGTAAGEEGGAGGLETALESEGRGRIAMGDSRGEDDCLERWCWILGDVWAEEACTPFGRTADNLSARCQASWTLSAP